MEKKTTLPRLKTVNDKTKKEHNYHYFIFVKSLKKFDSSSSAYNLQ